MTTIMGCDYSFSRPPYDALQHFGIKFAGRYYSTPDNPKNLDKAEADALLARGIDIVSVYETTADFAMGGHAAGVEAAYKAASQAEACGQPHGSPLFYAVDFDAGPQARRTISEFFLGVYSAHTPYAVGVYGSYYVCQDAVTQHPDIHTWQTIAWSGGRVLPGVDIYQDATTYPGYGDLDRDYAYNYQYGGWHHHKGVPAPVTEEEDPVYVHVGHGELASVPIPQGKYDHVMLFQDVIDKPYTPIAVRVATKSAAETGFVVNTVHITDQRPVVYLFPHADVVAVSIQTDAPIDSTPLGVYFVTK